MKPPEVFAIVVRTVGLVSLLYLLTTGVLFFAVGVPLLLIIRSIVLLIVSMWLLRGAPQVVRFAYPDAK